MAKKDSAPAETPKSPFEGQTTDNKAVREANDEAYQKKVAEQQEQDRQRREALRNPPKGHDHPLGPASPLPKGGIHEAVKRGGEVPLPKGHQRNPPGSIPRSPGELPTGAFPPENPEGEMTVGRVRPASERLEVAEQRQKEAERGLKRKPNVPPDPPLPPGEGGGGVPRTGPIPQIDMAVALLAQFNVLIPVVWGVYRSIRDRVRESRSDVNVYTDEQLIQMMREPADRIVQRANEWLAANQPTQPSQPSQTPGPGQTGRPSTD